MNSIRFVRIRGFQKYESALSRSAGMPNVSNRGAGRARTPSMPTYRQYAQALRRVGNIRDNVRPATGVSAVGLCASSVSAKATALNMARVPPSRMPSNRARSALRARAFSRSRDTLDRRCTEAYPTRRFVQADQRSMGPSTVSRLPEPCLWAHAGQNPAGFGRIAPILRGQEHA